MKILIDINDEMYEYILSNIYDEHISKRFDMMIRDIIIKGTPLQKEDKSDERKSL